MENIVANCPTCRAVCDLAASIRTNITSYCPIAREDDMTMVLMPCCHGVGVQSYHAFVHNFGRLREAESSLPAVVIAPEAPPPPPIPRWYGSWTECRYPEFYWRENRLLWVHFPFSFHDISLINVETGNLYWEGKHGPPPPPPPGVEGVVSPVQNSRRWIFSQTHTGV